MFKSSVLSLPSVRLPELRLAEDERWGVPFFCLLPGLFWKFGPHKNTPEDVLRSWYTR